MSDEVLRTDTMPDSLRSDLARLVKEWYCLNDMPTVLYYEESTESEGFCDTCYYEYEAVTIYYMQEGHDRVETLRVSGSFPTLIRHLSDGSYYE